MNQPKTLENGYQSRIRTNIIRLVRWNGAWVAATALMAFGPKFLWNKALVFTLLAVGLDVAVGVGMILANKKYLAELDELQRKVHLNALGITVGVGLIAGIPYSVMDALPRDSLPCGHRAPGDSHESDVCCVLPVRHVAVPMKNRLKVLRAERNWTQAQLADALDVSRQTINAIETGKFDPSLPLAFRAARLFGMRIEEIFHDEDRSSLATEIKMLKP